MDPNVELGTLEHNLEELSMMTLQEMAHKIFYTLAYSFELDNIELTAEIVNHMKIFGRVTPEQVERAIEEQDDRA